MDFVVFLWFAGVDCDWPFCLSARPLGGFGARLFSGDPWVHLPTPLGSFPAHQQVLTGDTDVCSGSAVLSDCFSFLGPVLLHLPLG